MSKARLRITQMYSSDEDLVKAVLSKDPHAAGEFVNEFAPRIYKVVKSLGGMFRLTEEDIEDYCQEVILHVFRNLEKWNPEGGKLTAWIARVSRNKTLEIVKKALKERSLLIPMDVDKSGEQEDSYNLLDTLQSCDPMSDEEIIEEESRLWTRSAIMTLSAPHREVVIRHYYRGQSYSEIATALSLSKNTVTMRLHHARRILDKRLKDYFLKG